jgi:hypothetical protein
MRPCARSQRGRNVGNVSNWNAIEVVVLGENSPEPLEIFNNRMVQVPTTVAVEANR